jgi:hypothetical protein
MQIRKKWLNQLKKNFYKRFWEYYLASFCWWISSSCENHCTLGYTLAGRWGGGAQSTYLRRVQSCVWRLPKYYPPLLLESVSSPRIKGGGTHSPGGEGTGGVIFWKTPAIGLVSYNNLSTGGGGVNILEDARHRSGLLQYNLSTVQSIGANVFCFSFLWGNQKEGDRGPLSI